MTSGTLGFIGKNLTEAREVRCLSVVTLSEMVGITKAAIYQYENGDISPSRETLQRLAKQLNFPEEFFSSKWNDESDERIFFRSLSADTRTAKKRAMHRMRWMKRITSFLSSKVEFPKVNLPKWKNEDFMRLKDEEIEEAALELRRFWGLGDGPIGNVVWLLENNGFIVSRSELIAQKQDALSSWSSECARPLIILGSDKASCARSRFDACHELAHMLLHRRIDQSILKKESPEFGLMEKQAHRFASAFLFPRDSFLADVFLVRLEALEALKRKWKLSIAMMLKRAGDLDLIGDEESKRLWRSLNRRGWRKIEPLDDSIPPEEPVLLYQAIKALLDSGKWTQAGFRSAMPLPVGDIENLVSTYHGFLDETRPTVRIMGPDEWADQVNG